jgi:hypothetical protein
MQKVAVGSSTVFTVLARHRDPSRRSGPRRLIGLICRIRLTLLLRFIKGRDGWRMEVRTLIIVAVREVTAGNGFFSQCAVCHWLRWLLWSKGVNEHTFRGFVWAIREVTVGKETKSQSSALRII